VIKFVTATRRWPMPWGNRKVQTREQMVDRMLAFTAVASRARIRDKGNFDVRRFGPWRLRKDIRSRVRNRTRNNGVGYEIFVQRGNDRRTLRIHKVEVDSPVPDLGCHPEIERAYAALVARFGRAGIVNGGIYVCRFVDGTRIVSKHGYRDVSGAWRGAACDIFSDPDTMGALGDRANFLVAETRAGRLRLSRVIIGQSVWESFDGRWHFYTGAFHRHVHFEVAAGSPCMR